MVPLEVDLSFLDDSKAPYVTGSDLDVQPVATTHRGILPENFIRSSFIVLVLLTTTCIYAYIYLFKVAYHSVLGPLLQECSNGV